MKQPITILIAFVLSLLTLFVVCGCMEAPPVVLQASKARTAAIRSYSANMKDVVATVIAKHREAERGKTLAAFQVILKVNEGKMTTEGINAAVTERDKQLADIDAACASLLAAANKAERDLAVEAQIADAVEAYESAGVNSAAATNAINTIISIFNKAMGK